MKNLISQHKNVLADDTWACQSWLAPVALAAPPHQIDAHDQKGGGRRLIREHSCFQSYFQLNTSSVALLQFAGRIPRGRTQQHRTCQKADAGAQGSEESSEKMTNSKQENRSNREAGEGEGHLSSRRVSLKTAAHDRLQPVNGKGPQGPERKEATAVDG